MAISRQVKCVNKPVRQSPNQRITHIGGDWGTNGARVKITEDEAIRHIEEEIYNYHVRVGLNDVPVYIAFHSGRKYLRTVADDTKVDNLLNLPECS